MSERPDPREVAVRVGMFSRRRRWGPCPACGATAAGSDSRPPVIFREKGWWCVSCKATGDGFTMVAYHLGLDPKPRGRAFRDILAWLGSGERCEVVEQDEEMSAISVDVMPALRAAVPISQARDPRLGSWLARRCIGPGAPAGWLPSWEESWWPRGWSERWPVVVPACTAKGVVMSMHGVAVDSGVDRKTTWPLAASARELLFASAGLRRWMRGEASAPERLLVVEGATDYLSAADQLPTIGATSGGFTALRLLDIPKTTRVYIGTDPDKAGRVYAQQIADALAPHPVRLLPLHRMAA
jgi:hypothetical protein